MINRPKQKPAGRGWYRRRDGTCERAKPCPKGTFRINNSDTLYELCGMKWGAILFRKVA